MTNQIKNFIEEGEKEFEEKFVTFGGGGSYEINMLIEHEVDELKAFISSRQISMIKMIVDEQIRDAEKAIKWAEDLYTKGYSESWKSGYLKAYEQVRNDLLKGITDGK